MNGQRLNIGRMETMDLEEAAVDTVMRGGDTDTNAAICGALLGAVWSRDAIPAQWDRMRVELPPCGRTGACSPSPS